MNKTKYKKVAVSERLPEPNENVPIIFENGTYDYAYFKNGVWNDGAFDFKITDPEYWLEEVSDMEDEMREMLEFIYGYGEKVEWSKVRPQLEELLTKLKHQ